MSNDDSRPVGRLSTDDLRRFVEDLARLTTAADDLADDDFRVAFAKKHGLNPQDLTEEDVLAEIDDERLWSETTALWEMIRRARELLNRDFPTRGDSKPKSPTSARRAAMVKYVCDQCGSEDVRKDAWAAWDVVSQTWQLASVFDASFCLKCDGQTTLRTMPIKMTSRRSAGGDKSGEGGAEEIT